MTEEEKKTLWVVGQWMGDASSGTVWDLQGVFSTEEKAAEACHDEDFFMGPVSMDEELPTDITRWPGFCCPSRDAMRRSF